MQPDGKISVIILDDHPTIVEGYEARLGKDSRLQVLPSLAYGDELEPALAKYPTDVLILDVGVPISAKNSNHYPILHTIPSLLQLYPQLNILVISMFDERGLIRGVMEVGASGYLLKDDRVMLQNLANVIVGVFNGGTFYSPRAEKIYHDQQVAQTGDDLSPRQLEALSLCASYPEKLATALAKELSISNSTFRNLLSGAYVKLGVSTRAAAILKAQSLGIITPLAPTWSQTG
jgi:DNA-binding NarL/FixJ family response regulator